MRDLCPLCLKNGIKRKIRAFQINLEEAVWACEGKDCIWPFGYDEVIFFKRLAICCNDNNNWEESCDVKQNIPMSTELSLYTPPVTPLTYEHSINPSMEEKPNEMVSKNDAINFATEFIGSNNVPLLKSCVAQSNTSTEESRNIKAENDASEQTSACKSLPIPNVQTMNSDVNNILENVSKNLIHQAAQKNEHASTTSTMDSAKDFHDTLVDINDNILCKEVTSNTQNELENKQVAASDNMQLNPIVNHTETDSTVETLSRITSWDLHTSVPSSLNDSIPNTTYSDNDLKSIDTLLENVMSNDSSITNYIGDEWLDMLYF